MNTSLGGTRALLVLLTAILIIAALPAPLLAEETPPLLDWGHWETVVDQPALPAEGYQRETPENWVFVYDLWQMGISSLSGLGPISPIQGRRAVIQHAEEIRLWASTDLELLVAASIAHQASDFKDRPFGTDAVEVVWRALIDDNISVGIAQLRSDEVATWAPYLKGGDLLAPDLAIRVMSAKLKLSDAYIRYRHPAVSNTDRYMLLALAQNTASAAGMRSTVDFFFDVAGGDWQTMLASERAQALDWQEQLRLVLLHLDWLVEQGWSAPAGLDRGYWSQMAFTEPNR
jgi:hypothetical protein